MLHGGVGEVAALAVLPFFVLFEQDGADQAGDGVAVGEYLDDVGAAFDFGVDSFDGVVYQRKSQCRSRLCFRRGKYAADYVDTS